MKAASSALGEARRSYCRYCKRRTCICDDPAAVAKYLTPAMRAIVLGEPPPVGDAAAGGWRQSYLALFDRGIIRDRFGGPLTTFGQQVKAHLEEPTA